MAKRSMELQTALSALLFLSACTHPPDTTPAKIVQNRLCASAGAQAVRVEPGNAPAADICQTTAMMPAGAYVTSVHIFPRDGCPLSAAKTLQAMTLTGKTIGSATRTAEDGTSSHGACDRETEVDFSFDAASRPWIKTLDGGVILLVGPYSIRVEGPAFDALRGFSTSQ